MEQPTALERRFYTLGPEETPDIRTQLTGTVAEILEEPPQLVEVVPEQIIYYYAVILLEDGSVSIECLNTEAKAVDHILFVSKKCYEKNIGIIRTFISPSDDPDWAPKFQNEHKKNLEIAKQKLLEVTLAGRNYGTRLRKIDYKNPEKKTGEFFTGPPTAKHGARIVYVPSNKKSDIL